ncbi:MAG: hypothetical protein WBG93_16585 [Thermoanaerobaculia bacterium]
MKSTGSRWPSEMCICALLVSLILVICNLGLAVAQESPEDVEGEASQWLVIGNFSGAAETGVLSRLQNAIFEYQRDDDLFRDLGDLGLGVGFNFGNLDVDWDNYFRRRVVQSHRAIPPGETVQPNDYSLFQTIDASRTRLRLGYDYFPDVGDVLNVGVQLEGGFAVAMARSMRPSLEFVEPEQQSVFRSLGSELSAFADDHDITGQRGLAYLTWASLASVVDAAAGAVGHNLADTEQSTIFWDDYAEPMMIITETGIPLKLRLFTDEDSSLAVGDVLSFTSFGGLSPVAAGARKWGIRISYRRFHRSLRETTVQRETDSVVLVRIRDWFAHGNEITPLKLRPEVRLWIIKIGYTFFETLENDFRERVADQTFRLDLKTEAGVDTFRRLIMQGGKLQVRPKLLSVEEDEEGVEVLAAETSTGKSHNRSVRIRFFNWYRYRLSHISSTRRIQAADAKLREVVRARTKEYKNVVGRKREVRMSSVITGQSNIQWREGLADDPTHDDEKLAVRFDSSLASRYARAPEISAWLSDLDFVLGLEEHLPVVSDLRLEDTGRTAGFSMRLSLSFGPRQIEQLGSVTADDIWRELAALLLGPEYVESWSTESKRYWWQPGAPSSGSGAPGGRHMSRYYDELRGYKRPAKKSRGFDPQQLSSAALYRLANKSAKRFQRLQRVLAEERDCLGCLVRSYSAATDVMLSQALMVRFAGGIEGSDVGYDFQVQMGDMVRPVGASNGIVHGYHLPRARDLVRNAETIRNSQPRLRGGHVMLNVSGWDAVDEPAEDPCWKLRLLSDVVFAPEMILRIDWRRERKLADRRRDVLTAKMGKAEVYDPENMATTEGRTFFWVRGERPLTQEYTVREDITMTTSGDPIGAVTPMVQPARYYYDIPLTFPAEILTDTAYTMLMRVLNSNGLPVSEEQKVRVRFPEDWQEQVPVECQEPDETEVAAAESTAIGGGW